MNTFKKGDIVLYSPSDRPCQPKFGCVVLAEPHQLGCGLWSADIGGLGARYQEFAGRPCDKTSENGVWAIRLYHAPTVYCKDQEFAPDGWHRKENVTAFNGEIYWHDGDKSWQDRGWKYSLRDRDSDEWTHGLCAESYEAARAAVEEICK